MKEVRTAQLDARLKKVASLVRPNAVFADIGCDHGHLAVELMRRGAIRGYACDINPGPLQSARRNIERAGFSTQIQTLLTNGLDGLEDDGLTDITIAGIGGEVITDILQRASFLKSPDIRLILQPQSRENVLRTFLAENGFSIISEEVIRSGRYIYVVMAAEYTQEIRQLSVLEAYCGTLPSYKTPEIAEKLFRTAQLLKKTAIGLEHRGKSAQAQPLFQAAEEISTIIASFPREQKFCTQNP